MFLPDVLGHGGLATESTSNSQQNAWKICNGSNRLRFLAPLIPADIGFVIGMYAAVSSQT